MAVKQILVLFALLVLCCNIVSTKHVKVLILGAGAAGIKAAETLHGKGETDFLVLEGNNYIGGRIQDGTFEQKKISLGSSSINGIGDKNPIWKLAKKLNMSMYANNYNDFVVRDGETGELKTSASNNHNKLKTMMQNIEDKMKTKTADVPLKSTLGMIGWNPTTFVDQTMEYFHLDVENGASPKVLSSNLHNVAGKRQDAIVNDALGYGRLLRYLARNFISKVRLNTIVTKIEQSGKKVTVTTKNGITYTADQALVTFSSGVLSNNLIEFVPRLPTWKMDTIHLMPMVHYCKVFFKFPMKFWDDNNYILLAQKTRGDRVHWQNLDKQPMYKGQNMLLLTLTEDLCLRADHMSDLDIIHEAMESLKKAYGASIPTPKAMTRSRWSNDRMTMGAFSSPVVGFDKKMDMWRLQHPVGRVWFAGDYTSSDWGRVHGAFSSGKDTALNIAACLRARSLCPVYREQSNFKKL